MDSRACTPDLVRVASRLTAEIRSVENAAEMMKVTLGHGVSAKTIERLAGQIGAELQSQLEQATTSDQEVLVPEVAVVSCDGGRIRTRAANSGPGVHDPAWRESKNASFEKMTSPATSGTATPNTATPNMATPNTATPENDPCPELPDTFRQVAHVANIAEQAAFAVERDADQATASSTEKRRRYQGPKRVLRTCLSSLKCSRDFGDQMNREACRRRFHEAARRVFIGDGLAWNWSIWREHFRDFTPILDFIHVVQYLYAAAQAWESTDAARWRRYLELTEAVWQGQVLTVIAKLEAELRSREVALEDAQSPEDSSLQPLVDAMRYLTNNRDRMDYPRYRRAGLPITSSPMESLIKQINHRVKGTEMFWNDPAGAEAILQIRAADLSEDGRLETYLRQRRGSPFTRRPAPTTAA